MFSNSQPRPIVGKLLFAALVIGFVSTGTVQSQDAAPHSQMKRTFVSLDDYGFTPSHGVGANAVLVEPPTPSPNERIVAINTHPKNRNNFKYFVGEILAERGFRGTSVRAITDLAGANLAAVGYHFGSKAELLAAVIRRVTGPIIAAQEAGLDRLLARLHANKAELLMVLERPEIPLHTNGSENDIRCRVTRRKISGGTRSDTGRDCRDAFLALAKTCSKLGISFWDYLGSRLAVPGNPTLPYLPDIVRQRCQPA